MKLSTMMRSIVLVASTSIVAACASLATQQSVSSSGSVREVDGQTYRVVRADPLYLYARDRNVVVNKRFVVVTDLFFSISPTAPLRPLTLAELKSAYPDNHRFHDALALAFERDADLVRWDSYHKEYVVSRLLRQSLQSTAAR